MTQFASDAFAAGSAAALESYDSAWVKVSGDGSASVSDVYGRVYYSTSGASRYTKNTAPPGADYSVSVDVYVASTLASSAAGPTVRHSGTTFYLARTVQGTGYQMFKCVSGSYTQLGSTSSATFVAGNTYNLKLEANGTAIKLYINGNSTATISATDSAITAANYPGIYKYEAGAGSETTGHHIDNFSADTLSSSGAVLQGAALVVASASGGLTTAIPLSGSAVSTSTAGGALTTQIRLSGSAIAQAVSSALLSSGITMTAAAVAQAAAQGTLVTAIQLLGGAQAQAGGSGSLTTSTGGLEGNAQASASAAASLSTQIRLSGAAIAQAGAAGSLGGAVDLSGAALSTASASGELTVTISLTAQALAQAIAQGSMTTSILLDADAAAQAQAGAQLSGGSAFVIPAARSARVVTGGRRPAAIQTTSRR